MGTTEEIHFMVRQIVDEFAQLEAQGWTRCTLPWGFTDHTSYNEVSLWCKSNCQGPWRRLARTWIFEYPGDHAWFVLKWL